MIAFGININREKAVRLKSASILFDQQSGKKVEQNTICHA